MHSYFLLILALHQNLVFASTQDVNLKSIGINQNSKEQLENYPTPLRKNHLLVNIFETKKSSEPLLVRPRIEYDDYLKIKSLPKVFGINLLVTY